MARVVAKGDCGGDEEEEKDGDEEGLEGRGRALCGERMSSSQAVRVYCVEAVI